MAQRLPLDDGLPSYLPSLDTTPM